MGDLLFTAVNLARHLKVDTELALRAANAKFRARFRAMRRAREASMRWLRLRPLNWMRCGTGRNAGPTRNRRGQPQRAVPIGPGG